MLSFISKSSVCARVDLYVTACSLMCQGHERQKKVRIWSIPKVPCFHICVSLLCLSNIPYGNNHTMLHFLFHSATGCYYHNRTVLLSGLTKALGDWFCLAWIYFLLPKILLS